MPPILYHHQLQGQKFKVNLTASLRCELHFCNKHRELRNLIFISPQSVDSDVTGRVYTGSVTYSDIVTHQQVFLVSVTLYTAPVKLMFSIGGLRDIYYHLSSDSIEIQRKFFNSQQDKLYLQADLAKAA